MLTPRLGSWHFFLGYFLFEVPGNLILAKVGARRWIARILFSWGVIACGMVWVKGSTIVLAMLPNSS